MKFKLMIQSLSPLALLTIIRNFSFVTVSCTNLKLGLKDFILANIVLLIVLLFCFIWVLSAVISLISFGVFKWNDKKSGYEICSVVEKEDASLNFFLTLIIPLLLDDVNTPQGALTFAIVVLLICILLYKTNLFYANPVLALLGYRVYEFSFKQNEEYSDKKYIGLCYGKLVDSGSIEFKKITNKVMYIRGM